MSQILYTDNKASEVMALLSSTSRSKYSTTSPHLKNIHYLDSQRYRCGTPDIKQSPRPFTSRCMDYFRNHTVEVIRSSLAYSSEGRCHSFPSFRQIYRWVLLLLLLLVDVKEEEPPEPPHYFARSQSSLPIHGSLPAREKPHLKDPQNEIYSSHPTPKSAHDNYCTDLKHDTHPFTYDELIAETDSLVIEVKNDGAADPSELYTASTKPHTCLLRSGIGHKNIHPQTQEPRCPCLSLKKKMKSFEHHVAPSQVLSTVHNYADPGGLKQEDRQLTPNEHQRCNYNRLFHASSSPDLRRQRSNAQIDPESFRNAFPQKQNSTATTCSSNSSISGKRPSTPRGPGAQLIKGKTIGEILHDNPLIRKDYAPLSAASWRS
ncbi:hypothetical protein Unana1_01773 [Umbelopsis nana]